MMTSSSSGQARLLARHVAPLLDDGLVDLPGVGLRPGTDLLGYVHTLLGGRELRNQSGDVFAGSLWLQSTFLLGSILDHSLHLIVALLRSLLQAAASGGTELPRLLATAGDRSKLLDRFLGHITDLLGPLRALGTGGVAGHVVNTLLLNHRLTAYHVVLHVMNLLLGPALGLVLSPADLRALHIADLHQRNSTDLNSLVKSNLLVVNLTIFPVVIVALLLLLRLVVGDVGGMASFVVAVVALHHVVVLDYLHHLYLVHTPPAVVAGPSAADLLEADCVVSESLM